MKTRKLLASLSVALITLVSTAFAQNTVTEATVTDITGKATVKLADGSTADVVKGMKLAQGAEITTAENTRLAVQAHDGITAVATSKTVITIDELSVSANGTRNATIGLKSGSLASALDPKRKAVNNYKVSTPKGVAAARGTVYSVSYNGGTLSVNVINGVVQSFSLTGVTLGTTSAGNVSTSTDAGTSTQTLAQAIAADGAGMTEALVALASSVAINVSTSSISVGSTADVSAVVDAIATAAGTSEAATAIVAQTTSSAAAIVSATQGMEAAASVVSSAVTASAQAGNGAAAGTIVATSTATISTVQSLIGGDANVSTIANTLTTATNSATAAANVPVAVDAGAVSTAAQTAVNTGVNINIAPVQAPTAPTTPSTSTAQPEPAVTIVITTPQPIDPGTISRSQ